VVVVTHEPPADRPYGETFTFVDSVEAAVETARKAAGDKNVVVASAKIAQQCLAAGLLDAIHVDQVPILLGEGVRWFENLGKAPVALENPVVVEGNGVTHLAYRVRRS
jgi:dihydrofolate reductase